MIFRKITIFILTFFIYSCNNAISPKNKEPVNIPQYENSLLISYGSIYDNNITYEFKSSDDKNKIFEWYIRRIPSDWIFHDSRSNNSIKFIKNIECFRFTVIIDYISMIDIASDRYTVSSSVNNRCQ